MHNPAGDRYYTVPSNFKFVSTTHIEIHKSPSHHFFPTMLSKWVSRPTEKAQALGATNATANQMKSVGSKEPATGNRSSQPHKHGQSHTHHESAPSTSPTHRPTDELVPGNGSKTGKKCVQPESDSVRDTAVDTPEQPDPNEGREKVKKAKSKDKVKKSKVDGDNEVNEDSDSKLCEDLTCSKFVRLIDYI